MEEDIVGQAEAIIMGEQSREQRGERHLWVMFGVYGVLVLLLVGVLYYFAPKVRVAYQEHQAAAARAEAHEQAKRDAESVYYSKPAWARTPQPASFEEVTEFTKDFLVRLGYTLHGELVYTGWTTMQTWGGAYKQYEYYALIDPAWPPLRLRCGPHGYDTFEGLSCYVFPRKE